MEEQEYLKLREESIIRAVRAIAPKNFEPCIVNSETLLSVVGRKGGKSTILRVKDVHGAPSPQFVVKIYNPGTKTIAGKEVHKEHYAMERAVLESIPEDPKTYVKALNYDNEFLFLVLPFIGQRTLEEVIIKSEGNDLSSLLGNATRLVKTTQKVLYDSQLKIEEKLRETLTDVEKISYKKLGASEKILRFLDFSSDKIIKIPEPLEQDFANDLVRYNEIFKSHLGNSLLKNKTIDKIAQELRRPEYLGVGPMDGYPWSMTEEYLFDAGAVKRCSKALHLGCLLGHHIVYGRIPTSTLTVLIRDYISEPKMDPSSKIELAKQFRIRGFIPASVYSNSKELAGALRVQKISKSAQKDIKGYLKRGQECIYSQLKELEE